MAEAIHALEKKSNLDSWGLTTWKETD